MEPKASCILGKRSESYPPPLAIFSKRTKRNQKRRAAVSLLIGSEISSDVRQRVKSAGWEDTVTSRTGWQKAVGENPMLLFICVARTQNPCP